MSENSNISENKVIHPMLAIPIGNTTYMVSIHFNEAAKETLDDKLKRLMCKDALKSLYIKKHSSN